MAITRTPNHPSERREAAQENRATIDDQETGHDFGPAPSEGFLERIHENAESVERKSCQANANADCASNDGEPGFSKFTGACSCHMSGPLHPYEEQGIDPVSRLVAC